MTEHKDYLVRALAAGGQVRAFACRTTNLCDEAQRRHGTLPVATAALGRTLSATLMMGAMLKRTDTVTVQISGDGPIAGILADADAHGHVRGYVKNPNVHFPPTPAGKLDVARGVGSHGTLYVIKDMGLREPYRGSAPLVSGELAEDFTYYFAVSEQTPAAVSLGVLVDTDNRVLAAGGFIIQLMPGAEAHLAQEIEAAVAKVPPVSQQVAEGATPEGLLERALGFLELSDWQATPAIYQCRCRKERLERVLISLGRDELESMLAEQGEAEIVCHFCGEKYYFTGEELSRLAAEAVTTRTPEGAN